MCGAFFVENNHGMQKLTSALGVNDIESRGIRVPASMVQIVTEPELNKRQLEEAQWWLLLDKAGKPNYQYATFNSRSDKLFSSRLTKNLMKTSRCILPASGVIEGQDKKYHGITSKYGAVALGGLYKRYQIGDQLMTTTSVITCPPNPKFNGIHEKSTPLMLDWQDKELINMWLDPSLTDSEVFRHVLTGELMMPITATPIKGARDLAARGEAVDISRD
jgi:putative SOS response-associated peptidase YedK